MSGVRVVDGVRSTFRELPWIFDDGGREAAGFTGRTGDCVTRAVAIATGAPYREVYDDLFGRARKARATSRARWAKSDPSPRTGVHRQIYEPYLSELGWVWTPTMQIGSGCTVHLAEGELPAGRLIVSVSKHICAVIDGVVRDTHDPTREGLRCVYGYYQEAS